MKQVIQTIMNNVFLGYLLSFFVIFLITLPTSSSFNVALVGSLFFGIFALPITALILSLLNSMFSE